MADPSPSAAQDALRRPSALTADAAQLRRHLDAAGDQARNVLTQVATGPGNTAADRVAAAVILAASLEEPSGLRAISAEDATDPQTLALTWSEQLRPTAREALGEPVIMSLLTWASSTTPTEAPVAAARTAAHLQIDDDGAIYRKVSQRAVQLAQHRGTGRARKDQLREFTEALGLADQRARQSRTGTGSSTAPAVDTAGSGSTEPSGAGAPASSDPRDRADVVDHEAVPPAESTESESEHPEHTSDAQPRHWTATDDAALDGLLGRGQEASDPRNDPDYGRPVGFEDRPDSRPTDPPAGPSADHGQAGVQGPPAPGPHRAYDPRALFDGPMSPEQRADEKNVLRNWGIIAAVLVVILIIVGIVI